MSSERLGDELVLCNVSVAPFPLEDVFPAAAAAGFEGVSMLARPHARAVRHGRTNRELCELITDRGLFVCEIEAAGDWLGPVPFPADSMFHPVYTVDELLDVGEALEARTLVATHFGAPVALDDAARAFAQLCHRALERGMRVALEFPAMATVADVSEAWAIVERADHPNGAILLDIWHHRRSTGTDADLARVPPDRVFGIQVSDGTAEPVDRRSRTSSTVACRAKETSEWRNYLVISIIAGSVAQWAWRSPEGHPRRRRPSSRGAPAPCPHRCDRCFSMTAP